MAFSVGSQVKKVGGDYTFEGTVQAVFTKRSGLVRYVVEDDRGVLHIYNERNLAFITPARHHEHGPDCGCFDYGGPAPNSST